YINTSKAVLANPGYQVKNRLTARLDPAVVGYSAADTTQFYRTRLERTRQPPRGRSAALAGAMPFRPANLGAGVAPEGFERPPGVTGATVLADIVNEHFFETMGMPILTGRGFAATDQENSPKVAVVNEAFAQKLLAGNPIGKRVRLLLENDTW